MKNLFIILLVVALLAAIAYIVLTKNGYTLDSVINTPETIDITVDCTKVENLLITSVVDVSVNNNSTRTHNNVTVRITAFIKNGDLIKEKDVTFERTLEPNGSLSKPVTLPAKARSCNCVVESSDPSQ